MTGSPTESLVLDQNAAANIRRVEELLVGLWQYPDGDDARPASMRACMGNLIVYLERSKDVPQVVETLADVVRDHPSRVILMIADPDGPDQPIEVSVSAQCWLEGAGRSQVCSEQIQIRASGGKIQDLPGIVIPLLVSDVPVHLWWRDSFLERGDLFEKFIGDIDHVIYDGLHWRSLLDRVPRVLEITHRLRGRVAVTNFNWSRLLPWQQRVAQFFDRGMYRDEIGELNRVTVRYHATDDQARGRLFQAMLLCGWLAGQLGWSLEEGRRDGERRAFRFKRSDGRPVEASIEGHAVGGEESRGLQKISLQFDRDGESFEFVIERDSGQQLLVMSVLKPGACGLPQKVRHASASPATLLLRGMRNYRSSPVFERAFAHAVAMTVRSGE